MDASRIESLTPSELRKFDIETVIFPGGGNRCWWQAGLIGALCEGMAWKPRRMIGVSAGAAIATAYACGRIEHALQDALEQFGSTSRNLEWRRAVLLKSPFVLPRIYQRWIDSFLNARSLRLIQAQGLQVEIGITRPISYIPFSVSAALALLLYASEKLWRKDFYATLPHRVGFRAEYFDMAKASDLNEARSWLLASAAATPITPAYNVGGRPALDGGFYRNVPLLHGADGALDTLVLLTRHTPHLPQAFKHNDIVYIQPGYPVVATNFDCTNAKKVHMTYKQGLREARQWTGA